MTYNAGYPTMKRIENWKSWVLLGWSRTSSRSRKAGYDSLTDSASHGEDKEGKSRVSALGASPHGSGAVSEGEGGSCHEHKRMQASHEHFWAGVRARSLTIGVTEFRKNLSVQCFTGRWCKRWLRTGVRDPEDPVHLSSPTQPSSYLLLTGGTGATPGRQGWKRWLPRSRWQNALSSNTGKILARQV